ncbi:MAG: DNA polymerase III subunit beta [Puniceicoccales bacterium]|jgi:DNA polymerase-3 subunit beta|nr:DNA polymerase III subunit beta [Puniceicoccales bacterium]
MKFKINHAHLINGLTLVNNIVSARSSMPILGNVLVEAEGETVSFTTTNLDLGIRVRIKAEVNTSGSITLPAKMLYSMVRPLGEEKDVVFEEKGQNLMQISAGTFKYKIAGIGAAEFPALPTFANLHSFSIGQGDLLGLLKKVSYAKSVDENRYVLNGVYFNFEEGKLTLVATDGRRLATAAKPVNIDAEQGGSLILPAKTVAELERLLGTEGDVKISFNDRHVSFISQVTKSDSGLVDEVHIVSKVVDGNYPNYRQVIPKETMHRIKLERKLFFEGVTKVAVVTTDKNTSIKFTVNANEVELSASSENGEADGKIVVEYDGPEVSIAFNPQYLCDPLRALVDDVIFFEFKDEMSPGVIKNGEEFLCVVMPQRLG